MNPNLLIPARDTVDLFDRTFDTDADNIRVRDNAMQENSPETNNGVLPDWIRYWPV